MATTLSVIVPIYKVEAYLDACIISILSEASPTEVILVDDASPDSCPSKCDTWATQDPRVKVVHRQHNGGLSAARNTGLDIATGDCIAFVDSDDTIEPGTLDFNLPRVPQGGVVCFPVRETVEYTPGYDETIDFKAWVLSGGFRHSYACNKIYDRSLWRQQRFPEGRLYEDMFTVPYVMSRATTIVQSCHGAYIYNVRAGQITGGTTLRSARDLFEANRNFYNQLAPGDDYAYISTLNFAITLRRMGGTPEDFAFRKVSVLELWHRTHSLAFTLKGVLNNLLRRYCINLLSL